MTLAPLESRAGTPDLVRRLGRVASMGIGALLVAWALSGFQSAAPAESWVGTPEWLRGRDVPAPLLGVLRRIHHVAVGHPSFLLGERSSTGWLHYFPVVRGGSWTMRIASR